MQFKIIVTILALLLGGCASPVIYSDNPSEVTDFEKARVYADCRTHNNAVRGFFLFPLSLIINATIGSEAGCIPVIQPQPQLLPTLENPKPRSCDSFESYADRRECRRSKLDHLD